MRYFLFLFLLISTAVQAEENLCKAWAYTISDHGSKIALRAKPSVKSKVVANADLIDDTGKECLIKALKGEWVHVRCESVINSGPKDPWVEGWMLSQHLGTSLGNSYMKAPDNKVYQRPSYKAKSYDMPRYSGNFGVQVVGCRASWLQVKARDLSVYIKSLSEDPEMMKFYQDEIDFYNKLKSGKMGGSVWIPAKGHCHNPLTTC